MDSDLNLLEGATGEAKLFMDSDLNLLEGATGEAVGEVATLKVLAISKADFPLVSGKQNTVNIKRPKVETAKTLNVHEWSNLRRCGKLKATKKLAIQFALNPTVVAKPRA